MTNTHKIVLATCLIALGSTAFLVLKKPTKKKQKPLMGKDAKGGTKRSDGRNVVIIPNTDNPFDMHYSEDVKAYYPKAHIKELSQTAAKDFASRLYKSKSQDWWSRHDRQTIQNIFSNQLKDKVALSNVSWAFWHDYKQDLWQYLNAFLTDEEMHQFITLPVQGMEDYSQS